MTTFRTQPADRLGRVLFEAEFALTDPEVRKTKEHVEMLLHPEFSETGSTGEVYDRATMIEMMTTEDPGEVMIRDFDVQRFSDDVAVVRYRSIGSAGQETRRTSVWVMDRGRWRLRHHQGTRVPDRWNQQF